MAIITENEFEEISIADLEYSIEEVEVHPMSPERKIGYRLVAIRGTPISLPVQIPYIRSEGPSGVYWYVVDNSQRTSLNGPTCLLAISENDAKQLVLDRLRSVMNPLISSE
jgi:hypothetical protein